MQIMLPKNGSRFLRAAKRRRKGTLVALSALSASIAIWHVFFLASWLLSFVIAKCLGSKEAGKPSRVPSIILPLGVCRIHLHHWLICSTAMVVALLRGSWLLPSELFYGLLSGVALHGIYYYDDWHKILMLRQGKGSSTTETLTPQESTPKA